jgi:hypothetical protein
MGYRNRQRLVSAEYEKRVYWSTRAEVSPTVLVDGRIIGTWSHKEEKNIITITILLFEKTNKLHLNAIKQQVSEVTGLMGKNDFKIILQG